MHKYRIVLADDHRLIRRGIRKILEEKPGVEVIGEVDNGLELIELLEKAPADLVIADISMPEMGGIEAIKIIKTTNPQMKVLVLTMFNEKEYLLQALSVGADGFLLKEDADIELYTAIEAIQKSGNYISPLLSAKVAGSLVRILHKDRFPEKEPTAREGEVLRLVAEGKSSKEIATVLGISVRTVENHRSNIMKKLNLRKNIQLVRYAIDKGYIEKMKA